VIAAGASRLGEPILLGCNHDRLWPKAADLGNAAKSSAYLGYFRRAANLPGWAALDPIRTFTWAWPGELSQLTGCSCFSRHNQSRIDKPQTIRADY
jgi:hypothetical protein